MTPRTIAVMVVLLSLCGVAGAGDDCVGPVFVKKEIGQVAIQSCQYKGTTGGFLRSRQQISGVATYELEIIDVFEKSVLVVLRKWISNTDPEIKEVIQSDFPMLMEIR